MIEVEITRIRKDNGDHYDKHEGITELEWKDSTGQTGIWTRQHLIDWIDQDAYGNQKNKAYVLGTRGIRAYCGVRENPNTHIKFLQTYADNYYNNNLLSLPELPPKVTKYF